MKKRIFIPAACILMLTACKGTNGSDTTTGPSPDATLADSISWYLGESASLSYWQKAANDSTIGCDKGKSAYEKGFRKGLEMLSADDAYNEGLRDALTMSQTFSYLKDEYETEVNKSEFFAGMKKGLTSDSAVNRMVLQQQMTVFFNRLQNDKAQKDRLAAEKIIAGTAQKQGFKKISDGFYYKEVTRPANDTVSLKRGDTVVGKLEVKDMNGQYVIPASATSSEIRVGNFPAQIVNDALLMMPPHSTYSFMTTASALFGNGVPRGKGLTADSPIIWTLTLSGFPSEIQASVK